MSIETPSNIETNGTVQVFAMWISMLAVAKNKDVVLIAARARIEILLAKTDMLKEKKSEILTQLETLERDIERVRRRSG
jgi:hypothetical protein